MINNTSLLLNLSDLYGSVGIKLARSIIPEDELRNSISHASIRTLMGQIQKKNPFLLKNKQIFKNYTRKPFSELAFAKVLGNVNPYLKGKKELTPSLLKKIDTCLLSLQQGEQDRILTQKNLEEAQKEEVYNRLRGVKEAIKPAKDYIEALAHAVAYTNWNPGDIIPFYDSKESQGNYIVEKTITNEKGLHIVVLVPDKSFLLKNGKKPPPVMAVRGSVSAESLIDDFKLVIGKRSLYLSLKEVERTLKSVTDKYGPILLCGHSLGGAICQHITSLFCDRYPIAECHLFSSPGCGKESVQRFEKKLSEMRIFPKIYLYRIDQDLVPYGGGPHLKIRKSFIAQSQRSRFAVHQKGEHHNDLHFFSKRFNHIRKELEHKVEEYFIEKVRILFSSIIVGLVKFFSSSYNLRKNKVRMERFFTDLERNQKI